MVSYRPQRSWAKVMFLQACVCPQGGGVSASVHARIPPPRSRPPPGTRQTHAPPPDQADTPPQEADYRIQSMSGRYASHWNAFLSVFSSTLAQSPMASRSYWQASDFLNYSPGLASDILAEQKSGKFFLLVFFKNCFPRQPLYFSLPKANLIKAMPN